MLHHYTEKQLWAHINHIRALYWAAENEADMHIVLGSTDTTPEEYERIMRSLGDEGLGELQLVVGLHYADYVSRTENDE